MEARRCKTWKIRRAMLQRSGILLRLHRQFLEKNWNPAKELAGEARAKKCRRACMASCAGLGTRRTRTREVNQPGSRASSIWRLTPLRQAGKVSYTRPAICITRDEEKHRHSNPNFLCADALADLGMSVRDHGISHDIHQKAYVDNGNKLIARDRVGRKIHVGEIITGTYQSGAVAQSAIFNNAASTGTVQFWEMNGAGTGGNASELEKALVESSVCRKLKEEFSAAGAGQFGSGLMLAGQGQGRIAARHQDRKRREPALLWSDSTSGLRRVGAQLLHRLPQQAPGLPVKLPRKAGKLGKRRIADVIWPRLERGKGAPMGRPFLSCAFWRGTRAQPAAPSAGRPAACRMAATVTQIA